MKMIAMLLALLIIGLLYYQQLAKQPVLSEQTEAALEATQGTGPKVPTRPDEIATFDKEMNALMQQEAEKRAKALKEAEGQ
ncbi:MULTISPECIES: hypothetical protein [Shewanella]|uniref:hypothetical protein n=1 Tax=Shewanella TaxID=22 RepID=UPI001C660C96|nr:MULTISPECIES: hypothetical protein [Shewanella]QYJ92932.1 hypothetical protein K0I31_15135 [Shewanella spartinae]QYK12059.1 hypothetical protein K0I63_15050 [Shewanella rhizosphaerae]